MTKNQVLLRFITRHGLPLSTMSILENTITLSKLYLKHETSFSHNLHAMSIPPCQAYIRSTMPSLCSMCNNNQKLKTLVDNQKLKTEVSRTTTTSKFIPKCNGKQSREDAV